jgi:hypothetical protein
VATARRVGEYVRREGGVSLSPGDLPSGKFPRAVAAEARSIRERSTEAADEDLSHETATRVFAPPRELVTATERERSEPEAYRSRRIIVAITLVLAGCGVGLLFTTHPSPPRAPPNAPVPAASSNP